MQTEQHLKPLIIHSLTQGHISATEVYLNSLKRTVRDLRTLIYLLSALEI